ncbi:MAG: arsenic efflux protein [Candidatus Eremiobacteraeota bacterium]|nr:arsenic efflux protein [Candidatus Eremiobacteraeota bacterium]
MLPGTFKHAIMITAFVFVMMVAVEYFNVVSRGKFTSWMCESGWRQIIAAAFLGITPGCLGAFALVALYVHRIISFGALTAGMISTSGDEAFVMLAMFPAKAILLFVILFFLGIAGGLLTDYLLARKKKGIKNGCDNLVIHEEEAVVFFGRRDFIDQWRRISFPRAILVVGLGLFLFGLLSGEIAHEAKTWIKITILVITFFGLFVVITVPDHFLEEHIWEHIAKTHLPRIFLWTFGALLFIAVLNEYIHLEAWIKQAPLLVLLLACLVGIIPESGPHLIFVTLFAQGSIPFSILLASSIVQDGHGMLPLLAYSGKDFLLVKIVNFALGFLVGLIGISTGW